MEGILVNISDHPILPFKRKIENIGFKPWWPSETLEVFLMVKHYIKNEDGSYGDEIISPSVVSYEDRLTASNVRKVDPVDGMEVYSEVLNQGTEQEETIWKRLDTNAVVESPIGQFDFFDLIIKNQPVLVGAMLSHFIQMNDVLRQRWNK